MDKSFYDSPEWKALRALAIERDGSRCTVSRLLGGDCNSTLHAHHIDPTDDPLDLDNTGTVCGRHHTQWESVRRAVVRVRDRNAGRKRCTRHRHPYPIGREACERKLNAMV